MVIYNSFNNSTTKSNRRVKEQKRRIRSARKTAVNGEKNATSYMMGHICSYNKESGERSAKKRADEFTYC